jgi:hypothetical protein
LRNLFSSIKESVSGGQYKYGNSKQNRPTSESHNQQEYLNGMDAEDSPGTEKTSNSTIYENGATKTDDNPFLCQSKGSSSSRIPEV